jgi:hypothetical protein
MQKTLYSIPARSEVYILGGHLVRANRESQPSTTCTGAMWATTRYIHAAQMRC